MHLNYELIIKIVKGVVYDYHPKRPHGHLNKQSGSDRAPKPGCQIRML